MRSQKMDLKDRNSGITGNSNANNNAQLLRDIEEISRALYLHRTPSKAFSSPTATHTRSKSSGKVRTAVEDQVTKQKKTSPSVWNWKNPLKALSHVGNQKIKCCFSLQVHSIEGLPSTFDGNSLYVYWKRKNSILQTHPSRVSLGVASFDDSLVHRCSVYVSRGGPPNHRAKYQAKLSLIYACIVGEPNVDLGKNLVDLTRLLPLSLEELVGVKSSGKWTTSFRLTGKAKGASLNVSFGFSVVRGNFMTSDRLDEPRITDPRSVNSSGDETVWNVERTPCNLNQGSLFSHHSLDPRLCHEVLLSPNSGLSKSISLVYQKLEEKNSREVDEPRLENVDEPTSGTCLDFGSTQESKCQKSDDPEFTVIDKGIELSDSLSRPDDNVAGVGVEVIDISEIIKDDDVCLNGVEMCASLKGIMHSDHLVIAEKNFHLVDGIANNVNRDSSSYNEDLDLWQRANQFMDQRDYLDVISNYKSARSVKKSLSLEDIADSVENDFLHMINEENCSFSSSFDGDLQSPRECLLRQFEHEALASSNFIMDFGANKKRTEFEHAKFNETRAEDCTYSNLSLLIEVAEEEHDQDRQVLINRRTGNFLEDLETGFLMHQWGINDEDFQNSPVSCSGGFGSPIQLAPEMPLPLPPIDEGLGPVIQTQDGGFLRSMSPSLFRNAKNIANLILQASTTVVLPSTLGSDVMEILQHMASAGVERLSDDILKLMPLQDINGQTIQQISRDAVSDMVVFNRHAFGQHEMQLGQDDNIDKDVEEILCGWEFDNLISEVTCDELGFSYSSLEDLVLGSMNQIEALSIEGLKIQTGMTSEKAPSFIFPQSASHSLVYEVKGACPGSRGFTHVQQTTESGCDVDELMDQSMRLDEWLKLDDGLVREDEDYELPWKTPSHQAKITYLPDRSVKCGTNVAWRKLLGNRLIVAIRMQLRDPFRNYEPVGMPMLALIQVQRVFANSKGEMRRVVFDVKDESNEALENDELSEEIHANLQSRFVVDAIHLAGVKAGCGKEQIWGSTKQLQYGHRWLLTSGIGKYVKHPQSKSTALIMSFPWRTSQPQNQDILWSITSQRIVNQNFREDIEYIRNPDVIFPC